MMRFIATLLVGGMISGSISAADVWIFSGQSNMKAIGGQAQRAVGQLVKKHQREFRSVYVAQSGKPIEAWLDSSHRDYSKLWKALEQKVIQAKTEKNRFKGFVWYQGESNANENAGQYQKQLTELVQRIRKLTDQPSLPAIIVQIGSATAYSGKDWAAATIREAQRRFARDDAHSAIVTAIDAEIKDLTVHLGKSGAEIVSSRIVAAADRLAYGNAKATWGPHFQRASFANKSRRQIIVEFTEVQQKLKLSEGWLAGFGVSQKTTLPEPLSKLKDATAMGQLTNDFLYPIGGRVLDEKRLILFFDRALSSSSRLSYGAMRNAHYGPHRRWNLEISGLRDGSGHQAPAFVLVPIQSATKEVKVEGIKTGTANEKWTQIAVNCVGRFPPAVTKPSEVAGLKSENWRQAYWNPVSSGLTPNLFDSKGRVSGVSFDTGVWYMSPYFRKLKDADDALMASWCKSRLHTFGGLTPNAKYDLAIYLLHGPPKKGEPKGSHRSIRVSVLHLEGRNKRKSTPISRQLINVSTAGTFDDYQVASADNQMRGNVLLLRAVRADKHGAMSLTIEVGRKKGDQIRWGDTTLAGVQIRSSD